MNLNFRRFLTLFLVVLPVSVSKWEWGSSFISNSLGGKSSVLANDNTRFHPVERERKFTRIDSNADFEKKLSTPGGADLSRVEFEYFNRTELEEFLLNPKAQAKVRALKLRPKQYQWMLPDFSLLRKFERLQELDLEDNDLGSAGMGSLAEALVSMKKIRILNLNRNDIGSPGLKEWVQILTRNGTERAFGLTELTQLNLAENNLDAESLQLFLPLLDHLKQLRILDLRENSLQMEQLSSIERSLGMVNSSVRAYFY